MFNIIGAMAEFERALIQERVKAGIRNALAKGRRIGRPRVAVDAAKIAALRASGLSWRTTERELGLSVRTPRPSLRVVAKRCQRARPQVPQNQRAPRPILTWQ